MRKVMALVRASWRSATSYRLSLLLSIGGLLVSVVPVYYVTKAFQPIAANAIRAESRELFTFVLIGMVAIYFISNAVNAIPGAMATGTATGTLEALLSTPTSFPTLLAGLTGYSFLWTTIRVVILLAFGALLGAHFALHNVLMAVAILVLIILAYLPFGLIAAASVLAFRTPSPLPQGVIVVSSLLGGVYYPTHVMPAWWLQAVSGFVPLTYGLRALRRTFLEGASVTAVAPDIGILLLFVVVLMSVGLFVFSRALAYAKRSGTLAQY